MNSEIIYEQPLNERIRTFLRLEYLFGLVDHFMNGETEWDVRSLLDTLLDLTDLISRTDIKNELIKELERHAAIFRALQKNPGVDPRRLDIVLNDIRQFLESLRDMYCLPGQSLKQNELVSSLRQRNAISGGTCNFDLPAYHLWLNRPLASQRQQLVEWQKDLAIFRNSILLILNLIRNSSNPRPETAITGFYQKAMEQNTTCQLIRVMMDLNTPFFPEISAGKHRVTIRFMDQVDTSSRPIQTDQDVDFVIHCCLL